MKLFSTIALLCLFSSLHGEAAPKYWVGPQNGDWGNGANWSGTFNGSGGAGVPGTQDSVIFSNAGISLVHVDQSTSIASLQIISDATLYASTPVTFTISRSLKIFYGQTLKDSTSNDVPFNLVLNGLASAKADIRGDWVFEGGAELGSRSNSGPAFVAEPGSVVTVASENYGTSYQYQDYKPGQVILRKNAGTIRSDKSSLVFTYNTNFILENDLDATIPLATWFGDQLTPYPYSGMLMSPASSIQIRKDIRKITFPELTPDFAKFVIDLPELGSDLDLSLPDGTTIRGNFEVYNSNGHTITLLAPTGSGSQVNVILGVEGQRTYFGGNLVVNGSNTKIALARAAPGSSNVSYKLLVFQSFKQSGGNFSLQDYNGASGASILDIRNDFLQTGGTFYTNSSSASGKFKLVMGNPTYITGPSGDFNSARSINVSSGTIDNKTHNTVLRIEHNISLSPYYPNNLQGLSLGQPLSVGRLELVKGPLTTTETNILTINDPSPDAVTLGDSLSCCVIGRFKEKAGINYINGPMRRATNSTKPYLMPTGWGDRVIRYGDSLTYSFHLDSVSIIPASDAPSLYQAEYLNAGMPVNEVATPLLNVSTIKYWKITRLSGADASVRLFLHDSAIAGSTHGDGLVTANFQENKWVAQNGTILTPGDAIKGAATSKPLSALGLFTFGYGDPSQLESNNGVVFDGLNYKYYEGGYALMPNFKTLTPVKTGNIPNIDLGIRRSGLNDSFAVVWEGYINIPTAGTYTFETNSDDGSKFYFNTLYNPAAIPLVDNDSTHPPRTVTGTVNISKPGRYPVTITYFENYGAETMELYWSGPGIPRQQVPAAAFISSGSPAPVTGGLNYKYYEGDFDRLPDFNALTPIKTGTSANIDINLRPGGINDHFAFTWDGNITIPVTGTYTLETISDDGSKISINGTTVVNNDGLHAPNSVSGIITLSAGTYPTSISYFEKDGGETMQIYWSGPGIPRQSIPNAAFSNSTTTPPPSTGNGLTYKYYEGDFNTLPDFSTLIPVKTGNSANADISVRPAGVDDHFAFTWDGMINLPAPGTYIFETVSDDGSRVYFNSAYSARGNSLVNNDGLHPAISATGTVTVTSAGAYPITITYFEKDGGETMQLYWTGPGIPRQIIPNEAFAAGIQPPATNGLHYKYYEGDFDALPDFSMLVPVKTGNTPKPDISIRNPSVNDHFAFMWYGYINFPSAGAYAFETISDDGSKVYVNMPYSLQNNSTVNNDGLHAPASATGTFTVPSAGRYPITITYFEKDGGEAMQLYWSGPGINRQLVPSIAFSPDNTVSNSKPISGALLGTLQAELGNTLTRIYPNPFIESFTVDYYNPGKAGGQVVIELFDQNGKLVGAYRPGNLVPGINQWRIIDQIRHLSPGIYMSNIKVSGKVLATKKLVKLK